MLKAPWHPIPCYPPPHLCPSQEAGQGLPFSSPLTWGAARLPQRVWGAAWGLGTNASCGVRGLDLETLLHLSCCVSLGEWLPFSGPQRPHLQSLCGDGNMETVSALTLRSSEASPCQNARCPFQRSWGQEKGGGTAVWKAQKPTPQFWSQLSSLHWYETSSLRHFFPFCDSYGMTKWGHSTGCSAHQVNGMCSGWAGAGGNPWDAEGLSIRPELLKVQ